MMTERKASYRIDYPATLLTQMLQVGIAGFVPELMFHPVRKWRFDLANEALMIALEVEGGLWKYGRHNNPQGFIDDCHKYNEAACLGWLVLRLPSGWIETGEALRYVECAVNSKL